MSEWWTYRLSDFLLFSADTYYRLFELYNQSIWPAHVLIIAVGIFTIYLLFRPTPWSGRTLCSILGASWLWIAWGYHLTHFSTVNWAASYYAVGFAVEGILLLWVGWFGKDLQVSKNTDVSSRVGLGLMVFGLVIQPVIGLLAGRPGTQIELWGLTPDPTTVFTLGFILLPRRTRWLLLPLPLLWCLISSATLWTMGMSGFWIMLGAAIITLVVAGRLKNTGSAS